MRTSRRAKTAEAGDEFMTATGARARVARSVAVLALLYVAAAVVYALLARPVADPTAVPRRGHLRARSRSRVAAGDGLAIRGIPVDLNSTLYVYLIAPAWKLGSGSDAFAVAQTIGAALLCLTVFPVWLLARRYVGDWLALIPAALRRQRQLDADGRRAADRERRPAAQRGLRWRRPSSRSRSPGSRWGWARASGSRCWRPSRARSSRS